MITISTALMRATAKAAFWQAYDGWTPMFEGLYYTVASDADQETYPWLGAAPSPKKMLATRNPKSLPAFDFTVINEEYESTITIGYKLRKFGKLGQIGASIANLGEKARAFSDKLMSTLLESGGNAYDNVAFFGDAHIDPGARYTTGQDNNLGANISAPTALTDADVADCVRTIRSAFWGYKDSEGDPVTPAPGTKIIVMVPPLYQDSFERLEVVDQYQGTSGTVGNDLKGKFTTKVNPFLTTPSSTGIVYGFNPGSRRKPIIWQVAEGVELSDDMGGDNEFMTKDVHFGTYQMCAAAFGDWRTAIKYTFS